MQLKEKRLLANRVIMKIRLFIHVLQLTLPLPLRYQDHKFAGITSGWTFNQCYFIRNTIKGRIKLHIIFIEISLS